MSEKMSQLVIALVGSTGSGKSRLGNKILGRNCFPSGAQYNSLTRMGSLAIGDIDNGCRKKDIAIVDTMGLGDTNLSFEDQKFNIADALEMCREGFDVIFFVIAKGRWTKDLYDAWVYLYAQLLGNDALRNTFVVITKCRTVDREKNLSELRNAIDKCELVALILEEIDEDRIIFVELGDEYVDDILEEYRGFGDYQSMVKSTNLIRNILLDYESEERYLTDIMRETMALYEEEILQARVLIMEEEKARIEEIEAKIRIEAEEKYLKHIEKLQRECDTQINQLSQQMETEIKGLAEQEKMRREEIAKYQKIVEENAKAQQNASLEIERLKKQVAEKQVHNHYYYEDDSSCNLL